MKTFLKFLLLVVLLNLARYVIGGMIESVTIMEPMHAPMVAFPDCFNAQFGDRDFVISLGYNFMLWFTACWVFHLAWPAIAGSFLLKSLKVFGLMCLFFISLAAVYMNHFIDPIKVFFAYSMLDALIVFGIVGLANGWLYPWLFRQEISVRNLAARQ